MTDWPKLQFAEKDWELQSQQRLVDGFFQLDQLTLTHRGYLTDSVGPMVRELLVRTPAVVVILCDVQRQQLVMVEQFRIGAAMSELADSPWMLEWVAGICDSGETPVETCRREVLEETGLVIEGDLRRLFTYYPSPGGSNELIHLYFAHCDASNADSFCGQGSEHEDLKVHVISIASALEALQTGMVNNAATIIGLQWLQANLDQLVKGE